MVRLTVDLIARGTSGYTKKRTDESIQHFLKRLSHLYLEEKGIDEVGDDLSACRNLIVLYLYDNKLPQIPNLNGNGNLTHLYLQNNQIERIESLAALKKLTKLYIGGNHITVVEGLDKLDQLQELHVENQHLPLGEKLLFDPRTLATLSRTLQVLNVSGNSLDSVRDLAGLSMLVQFMAADNLLADMKEMAHVLSAWRRLTRLELIGNPLCHKAKYRDRIIIMAPSLDTLDGKEITATAKEFLRNWQANKEAVKRKRELTRTTSHFHENNPHRLVDPSYFSRPHWMRPKNKFLGEGSGDLPPVSSQAMRGANAQIPGYIMPALPRKQFQEVLARSASQPNSGQFGQRTPHNGHTYPDLTMGTGPRYLNTLGTPYHEVSANAASSTVQRSNMSANPSLHRSMSGQQQQHKANLVNIGSEYALRDGIA